MCADAPFDKRTYQHRKVFTQTGRVPRKKINIDRGNLLNNKVKYRSKFELNLARTLVSKNVTFFYEQDKFEYIPAPRHYTPDFYFPTYADWCVRYNFEWAEGSIPMEWVKK